MTNRQKPLALIGADAKNRFDNFLAKLDIKTVYLPSDNRLALPVSSHSDMLVFKLEDIIVCNTDYHNKNIEIFNQIKDYGYKILPTDFKVFSKYPNDISLNQALIGKYVVGLKEACEKSILEIIEKRGYEYLNIKQGYAKCSTLVLNEHAIISADKNIIECAKNIGCDMLKIENNEGAIAINDYNYGFIGGASFVYENSVYFFGNLDLHPECKKIRSFCESHGFSTVSLDNDILYDVGGAIILPYLEDLKK